MQQVFSGIFKQDNYQHLAKSGKRLFKAKEKVQTLVLLCPRNLSPMRRSLFLLALLFPVLASAQSPLRSFAEILSALKAGQSVKTVIYYGQCKLFTDGKEQEKSPNAIGGMKLDTYEYFDSSIFKGKMPSFISTSQTLLINHPRHGYVYNYVKLRIKADGKVEITARYLKPRRFSAKYKTVMDEMFKTAIGEEGIKFFAE